ncbi:mercuric transport protein periplasmic component [Nitrosococcus halophilus Nc 4]|uniref:Periplasmic mercury ion-binding protein n=1 Tax=Nitrosococcus halophilus (strain Nc4) TaxID=472759 RepID=D5C2E7_NITHN|nr:mercury resistance system periplasmic binding protein MerP [Nitrosococcus halophilus]ADE14806.1 mercuric transport protein periplasmic component [Nitrosococcus halophilus Nc 4]
MKHGVIVLVFMVGLLSTAGAWAGEKTVTLEVENMTCALCPVTVRKALEALDGVQKVEISLANKTARVTFEDEKTTLSALTAATTHAGYPSRLSREKAHE